MRMTLGLLATAGLLAAAAPAAAQNYPWCARYFGRGGTNCGFVSYAQCMETARGAGAFCDRNSMFVPVGAPVYGEPVVVRQHRHRRHN